MTTLKDYRLVFVGPALGKTAVGDYAEDFVNGVRPYFGEVAEVRTDGPGEVSVGDLRRTRREVAAEVAKGQRGRVLVHVELSAGALAPFWSTSNLTGVPVTATVHDPPQGVWLPARTRFITRSRVLTHGIHLPLRSVTRAFEGRVYRDRTLVALTETGRRSIERIYPATHTVYIPHLVRERPTVRPAEERPRAIGFFGHVYRGKGFEQIVRIRELLPDGIAIRVAGRGTEDLPEIDGVDVLGPVDGASEDAFFESVRAIVVPYGKRHWAAASFAASGVVAHSMAYRTPVVSTDWAALAELDEHVGAAVVPVRGLDAEGVAAALAETIGAVVDDESRLAELGRCAEKARVDRSTASTAAAFAATWSELLALGDGRD